MRAKKTKRAPRSIRYLLSIDQHFKKISLKKISERLKKRRQPPKPSRSAKGARGGRAASARAGFPGPLSPRVLAAGAFCLLAATALIVARQPVSRPAARTTDLQLDEAPRAVPAPSRSPVVPRTASPASANAPKPKSIEAFVAEGLTKAAAAPAPAAVFAEPEAGDVVSSAESITVTGCLAGGRDAWWLNDPSGIAMPKGRSWKSGFLRKRSPRIELVDAANTLSFSGHLGERISASGILVDRELRVRSLQRIAASCD